ncbi:hypothetical protein [Catenulispora rubra]|uniref:hypothetical protein n=1 Tax=Catenulispora rubra TaxID=280293 RepID=UPI00189270BC|nr:hypothetical protein [Catenulispora rubra]
MTETADSSFPASARIPVFVVIAVTAYVLGTASRAEAATTPAGPVGPASPGTVLGGGDITVSTVMAPGSLVISVPLKDPPLAGWLQPIVVTDNRTGDPGWTVTAILTDQPTDRLGWKPNLLGAAPGESIVLGPAFGVRPDLNLDQPRILASAAPGASLGTARLDAALSLDTPSAAGPAATFTLTAI